MLAGGVQGAGEVDADTPATGEKALAKELNKRGNRLKNVVNFLASPFTGWGKLLVFSLLCFKLLPSTIWFVGFIGHKGKQ